MPQIDNRDKSRTMHDIDAIRMRMHPIDACFIAEKSVSASGIDAYGVDWGHLPIVIRYHRMLANAVEDPTLLAYRTDSIGLVQVRLADDSPLRTQQLARAIARASRHTCGSCGRSDARPWEKYRLVLCDGCANIRGTLHSVFGLPPDFRWIEAEL